jgi:hypothetical protein
MNARLLISVSQFDLPECKPESMDVLVKMSFMT